MQNLKYFLSANKFLIGFIFILMLASFTVWLSRIDTDRHGLSRVHTGEDSYSRQMTWLWMTIEGDEFTNIDGVEQVDRVEMSAYIWMGNLGEYTWRIAHTGNVTITIDDTVIFEVSEANRLRTDEISFSTENESIKIDIDAQVDINTSRTQYPYRTEFGIYEQDMFGRWSLIAPHRIHQNQPDTYISLNAYYLTQFSRFLIALSLIALTIVLLRQSGITVNRNILIIAGIVVLSLILRFIVMGERFYSDPFFHFIVPAGDDNYILMGQQLLSGDYQLAGTFWPSAPILWFAGIVALVGPQLWKIYIANILLSGLATGAVSIGAWQAFDSRRIGIIAGLLFALYPPLIFYQVTPQSVVLDAALASFALFFGILAIKQESYLHSVIFGIMISLGGMSRGIALLLGLAFFLSLIIKKPVKGIQLTSVAAIFSLLTLLPQDWANYSATGELSIVPYSNGSFTLYSGNNHDANGVWTGRGDAWEIEALTEEDWTGSLLEDFRQDSIRMIELNLRKVSMFWNNFEYVSNVNYEQQGIGKSRLIAILSANGKIGMALLSFFVWIGMVQLLSERKRENYFIILGFMMLIFGTILFVLAGRLRVPVMPFLMVSAAVGISSIWDAISTRKLSRRFIASITIAIALSVIFPFMDANLPRKSYVTVPETVVQHEVVFNDEIRLVGFDPIETNYSENGYFYISLYWEILNQPSHDYRVVVELADENGRIVGVDRELGSITYPARTATQLRVGGIIQEGYLMKLPDELPDFASVNVRIYSDETDDSPLVRLFDVGFDYGISRLIDARQYYAFGMSEELTVVVYEPVYEDSMVEIEAIWQAEQQIYEDYVIFIQVLDSNGNLVVGDDSPDVYQSRKTSSLAIIRDYSMTRILQLPDNIEPGHYEIVMGIYKYPSIERVPVVQYASGQTMPDGLIPLGEITIES